MRRGLRTIAIGIAALGLAVATALAKPFAEPPAKAAPKQASEAFFEQKIQPALTSYCISCHDDKKSKGSLKLDSRVNLLKGGDSGPAVVPGDAAKSLLIQAIRRTHDDLKMPPEKPLPPAVVEDFVAWVNAGAVWPGGKAAAIGKSPKAWAFEPVKQIPPPVDASGWSLTPIDRFIQAKLSASGGKPAGPADKHTLIRRVTFDLTGLPPTPEEVETFLADQSPKAFETVVDRLLASPRYGERWGRHWLDVVRYADSGGFESDYLYQTAWRYRDYVIRAFNADKRIDRFIQEQVAGDELWPKDNDAIAATGLYCVGPVLEEATMVDKQLDSEWMADAADTTGSAFLGLTFGCARCHDHKYDPLTQRDYYSLQAVFAGSDRPYPDNVRNLRIKVLNNLLLDAPVPPKFLNDPRCEVIAEKPADGLRMFHRKDALTVHRLHRGELNKPREVANPAFPVSLNPTSKSPALTEVAPTQRRTALAKWLTSPDHTLTARVFVNRVWGWHFGQAIVRTPNDFGAQGELPTHPELLDWLARDFVDNGWSLKRLHRQILLSKTYQMSSVVEGLGLRQTDAENRLLWRFPRRRLESESIRDAMLFCAGTLNTKEFGPPIVPPLSAQELTGLFGASAKWQVTEDKTEYTRRSVYLLARRSFVHPLLAAFDPPDIATSCAQRARTIVPTQALTLLNSPLPREQSAALAKRLLREQGEDRSAIVTRAWKLTFGRAPTKSEAEQALAYLQKRSAAPASLETALTELCLALFNANEFVFLD